MLIEKEHNKFKPQSELYKSIVLVKRPDESFPHNLDIFKTVEKKIPSTLEPGHVVVKVIYVSIDPIMRVWLSGAQTYIDSVGIDTPVPSFGVGMIINSNSKKWKIGDVIFGTLEWAEYCIREEKKVFPTPPGIDLDSPDLTLIFSVYGVTGVTALLGLKTVDDYNLPGENKKRTCVVSSAAGSTGSYAVQVAKYRGYKVVGIVGSEDKVEFVKQLGASDCVAYKNAIDPKTGNIDTDKLSLLIHKACPEGINVYYDNAGEEVLDAVLPCMNEFGNIILCGATATYNQWKQRGGLSNLSNLIMKRIKAYGIIFYGEKDQMFQGFAEMIELVNEGHVKYQEEILNGVEMAPFGLKKVYLGDHKGKVIIKVDKEFQLKSREQPKL